MIMDIKPEVSYEDFKKLDIRVGTVTKCERHPNGDNLLVFEVDFKDFQRVIISSITKYYPKPEQLIGKQVSAVVNFKPVKLRGIESNGMLLTAENEDDTMLTILTTLDNVDNGLMVL